MKHWTDFKLDNDNHMDGTTVTLSTEAVLKGFFELVFRHYGNPSIFITLNNEYQKCTMGSMPFQVYSQEISLLATLLGLDMETKEFRGKLQYNLAPYLNKLSINKRYKTVEEAANDLQMIDTEYRLIEAMKGGRRLEKTEENPEEPIIEQLKKEIKAVRAGLIKNPEHETGTPGKAAKKRERRRREPGSIDEPCTKGDGWQFKETETCWRQH